MQILLWCSLATGREAYQRALLLLLPLTHDIQAMLPLVVHNFISTKWASKFNTVSSSVLTSYLNASGTDTAAVYTKSKLRTRRK